MDISPVQNAINTVRERMNKLKNAYERIEKLKEVDEGTKSLVQGTVDPGVNGGLPKYTKFMDKNFKEANPDSAQNQNAPDNAQYTALNRALNISKQQELSKQDYVANDSYDSTQQGKAGWCYIGSEQGYRSCSQVGEADTCMSGNIFPTQDICVNPSLRA
jgi:hypothetical protein